MQPDEARTLAGFLKGAFPAMTDEQVEVYESSLLFEDATFASKAILDGIREWKFPPRYAEIVERIRILKREAGIATAVPEYTPEQEADFSKPIPFWVKRWVVARFVVDPRDMRPFQESYPGSQGQLPVGEGDEWMPEGEYVEQAKRVTDQQVRAAMARLSTAELLAGP
jgi:hypothetical protein